PDLYNINWPPFTSIVSATMELAASDARQAITVAHSFDVPTRPSGVVAPKPGIISGVEKTSWKGVSMTPGETALTRTPWGASSFAIAFVSAINPPLAVA